jgi:hypothetical protein
MGATELMKSSNLMRAAAPTQPEATHRAAAPTPGLFLSPAELQELTGYKLGAKQITWLREHRWLHEIGGDGRPKVLRAHVLERLSGKSERKDEPRLRLR